MVGCTVTWCGLLPTSHAQPANNVVTPIIANKRTMPFFMQIYSDWLSNRLQFRKRPSSGTRYAGRINFNPVKGRAPTGLYTPDAQVGFAASHGWLFPPGKRPNGRG